MRERYIKVFTNNEEKYLPESPIIIRACALLKDTLTETMIAQCKLVNVSGKTINYVKIAITPLDAVRIPLSDPITYEYMDISISNTNAFGDQKPLVLPNSSVREFYVGISCVGFSDGSVWTSEEQNWQKCEQGAEIVKRIEINEIHQKALLLMLSSERKDICNAKAMLQGIMADMDVDEDIALCDKFLLMANEKDQQKIVVAKKRKKRIITSIVGTVIALAIIYVMIAGIIPSLQVAHARKLVSQGNYKEAFWAYAEMDDSWAYNITWSIGTTQEKADCFLLYANDSITKGDITGLFEACDCYGTMVIVDSIRNETAPVVTGEAAKQKLYNSVIAVWDTDQFKKAVYSAEGRYFTPEYYLMKYILTALPDNYRDVKNLKKKLG